MSHWQGVLKQKASFVKLVRMGQMQTEGRPTGKEAALRPAVCGESISSSEWGVYETSSVFGLIRRGREEKSAGAREGRVAERSITHAHVLTCTRV